MTGMEYREQQARKPRRRKRKDPMKIAVVVLSILLVVSLCVALRLHSRLEAGQGESTPESTEQRVPSKGEIVTPVGTLTFPEEWVDSVNIERLQGDQYAVRVSGTVAGEAVTLFELSVGGGTGYLLGEAPDEAGKSQPIWVNISEIQPKQSWSEEEIRQINLLQSCVNDLMDQIYNLSGFVAG